MSFAHVEVIEAEDEQFYDELTSKVANPQLPLSGSANQGPRRSQSHRPSSASRERLVRDLGIVRRRATRQAEQVVDSVENAFKECVGNLEASIKQLRNENEGLRMQNEGLREQLSVTKPRTPGTVVVPPSTQTRQQSFAAPPSTPPKMRTAQCVELSADDAAAKRWTSSSSGKSMMRRSDSSALQDQGPEQSRDVASRREKPLMNRQVFADADAMKERVRQAVMRPEYQVGDFYNSTGCCQAIAKNPWFDLVTQLVIAFNAIWIAVDLDYNKSDVLLEAKLHFQLAEFFFIIYFTFEAVVRIGAFKSKYHCLKDTWLVFDCLLVIVMILETIVLNFVLFFAGHSGGGSQTLGNTSILGIVRLVRLTKMARMVRLLRACPEMMVLVKGIWVATRSVLVTLLLLTFVIYVFAIMFTQLRVGEGTPLWTEEFRTVPRAMNFLLLKGTLPDLADTVEEIGRHGTVYAVLFLIFTLLSSLTVMNMLIGVLVDVVSVVSCVEKEEITMRFVKRKMLELLRKISEDGSDLISKTNFESMLLDPEAAKLVQQVGVDVVGLVDFADFIFKDEKNISFPEFMELILQLRGSNVATVKDIVDLRKFVTLEMQYTMVAIREEISRARRSHARRPSQELSVLKASIMRYSPTEDILRQPVMAEWDV